MNIVRKINLLTITVVFIYLLSLKGEARRIKGVYLKREVAVSRIEKLLGSVSKEKYQWLEVHKEALLPQICEEIIQKLQEIRSRTEVTSEDLEFIAGVVTYLGKLLRPFSYNTYYSPKNTVRYVLYGLIFPYHHIGIIDTLEKLNQELRKQSMGIFSYYLGTIRGEKLRYFEHLPSEINGVDFVIDNLLFFFNYLKSPIVVGIEQPKGWYHGTYKGIVEMAYNQEGRIGSDSGTFVTTNFQQAIFWADPFKRERDVDSIELDDEKYIRGLLDRFKSLEIINEQLFSGEILEDPNRFQPVVLTFREDCLQNKNRDFWGGNTSWVVPHKLSLNFLTKECKEILAKTFGWTEVKPWMDEEWRQIIKKRTN